MPNLKPVKFGQRAIDATPAGTMNDVTLAFDVNGDGFSDVVIGGPKGEDDFVWYEWPPWTRRAAALQRQCSARPATFQRTRYSTRSMLPGGPMHEEPQADAHWARRRHARDGRKVPARVADLQAADGGGLLRSRMVVPDLRLRAIELPRVEFRDTRPSVCQCAAADSQEVDAACQVFQAGAASDQKVALV